MSSEIKSAVELRQSIISSRGGIERFDGVQQRLLDAVVSELAKRPDQIDVRVVSGLQSMLPPVVTNVAMGGSYDLSKLDVEELSTLESILAKAVTGEAPVSDDSVRELLELNAKLLCESERLRGLLATAEQSEGMWKDKALSWADGTAAMQQQIRDLESQLWRAQHSGPAKPSDGEPARSSKPSNVVALQPKANGMHGEGSYAIDTPLSERYPHLRDRNTEPVS